MADLDRLNELYDLCVGRPVTAEDQLRAQLPEGDMTLPPPPSLEAIEGWLKRHRDLHERAAVTYARLDAALENVEEARRKR